MMMATSYETSHPGLSKMVKKRRRKDSQLFLFDREELLLYIGDKCDAVDYVSDRYISFKMWLCSTLSMLVAVGIRPDVDRLLLSKLLREAAMRRYPGDKNKTTYWFVDLIADVASTVWAFHKNEER